MNEGLKPCYRKEGHYYEAVYDEKSSNEVLFEKWFNYHRKKHKEKIYKKHVCNFCGDVIEVYNS